MALRFNSGGSPVVEGASEPPPPPEGLSTQRLWTPPPEFLTQQTLGGSEATLREPLFRTEFQKPPKVRVPPLFTCPNSSPSHTFTCSARSRYARRIPAAGPWHRLSLLPVRPVSSYLYGSFPSLLKVLTKMSLQ